METVKMHGPAFDGTGDIVERNVPVADEQAYVNAGYVRGPLPKKPKTDDEVHTDGTPKVTYTDEQAAAQVVVEEEIDEPAPVKRGRRAK